MSEMEKFIRAYVFDVLASTRSVVAVSINSKNVEKLCENAREAFPLVLKLFETFQFPSGDDQIRTRDALAVLLRRLGVTLGIQHPDYRTDEWVRWKGWGRQILRQISGAPK